MVFIKYKKRLVVGVICLLMAFYPILEYIKRQREKQGYNIPTKATANHIIRTPFADDFNVISQNSKYHQNLVTDVKTSSRPWG